MIIDSFERACDTAKRDADRRQEPHGVTRWPDEHGHRVERLAHVTSDEVLFTAQPDPSKAPRKFWTPPLPSRERGYVHPQGLESWIYGCGVAMGWG